MPSAKSGSPGTLVSPTAPEKALDADVADPGQVEELKERQRQTQTGKYGKQPAPPFKPEELEETKPHWIEIELVDEDGAPVPGEMYRITMPDESVAEGTLDAKGCARVEGIKPGNCKITFPKLDQDAWRAK